MERHALEIGVKFHNITLAGESQLMGDYLQSTKDQHISPALPGCLIVSFTVEKAALHSPKIFLPLLLQMDQCPLPPAECEVLQAGEGEEIFRRIGHPMRMQVTPAGNADSSTST